MFIWLEIDKDMCIPVYNNITVWFSTLLKPFSLTIPLKYVKKSKIVRV